MQRRQFLTLLGGVAAASLGAPYVARAASQSVVVVGGGFGGATAARYLRRFAPQLQVTLVEPAERFYTCPFSNTVLAGMNDLESIAQGFDGLRAAGVKVVHARAEVVDGEAREVRLADGSRIAFDRAIVSPGIDFDLDAIEGLDEAAFAHLPHAWKAGEQTTLLRRQLEAMADGGTFIIAPPRTPFRCPPGPGERISLVAHYFKQHKPRSRILVLDPKESFSKQALFQQAWAALYPGMIEYRLAGDDGTVRGVDAAARTLFTDFAEHRGDVVNLIPPQRAADIARDSGLTDATQWCPVEALGFESTQVPGVHVIGDAAIANPMPKSGFSASNQARVAAAAVAALLRGEQPSAAKLANTCYSLVAPDHGISIAMVYHNSDGALHSIEGAGGLSPLDADISVRRREAEYARGWYASITREIWG